MGNKYAIGRTSRFDRKSILVSAGKTYSVGEHQIGKFGLEFRKKEFFRKFSIKLESEMFRFLNCTKFVTKRFKNEISKSELIQTVTSIILLRIINARIY